MEGAISRDYVICDVTFYELNSPIPQSRQIPNRGIVTQDYRKASLNMQFLHVYALRIDVIILPPSNDLNLTPYVI